MKIKILTDTSCGILRDEVKSLGYEMIALPFILDEKEYDDDKIDKATFYEKLKAANDIHTSQASMEIVADTFDRMLKDSDLILYFPITSGLSSAYANSLTLIDDDKYKDKIICFDHRTISVLQRTMLSDIKRLLDKGLDIKKIKELVEKNSKYNRIYIAVDTLDYLKKGGRVSALAATVGNLLSIKPILFSDGGTFSVVKKARGLKAAEEGIVELLKNDLDTIYKDVPKDMISVGVAYTVCKDEALNFKNEIDKTFSCNATIDELPSVVGCHIGEGAVAAAFYKHIDEC